MHHNPHMQMKDSRIKEGEDKRAISIGRQGKHTTAHSPSARQPTTAEKYTLFGYSEDNSMCKTPQTGMAFEKQIFVVSPYMFHRNTESRFHFARSMDPKEEAAVCLNIPEEIQDILERNIRTMSNKANQSSVDNTSSTDVIDFREDWGFLDRFWFENERMV
eukprot:CAMPEP_0168347060 /NCGR_PEP_ID=MMETSP0213-20121227/18743_1 /TAXON_ID=151035 /ORGANISM="Euplotes harpa, Strain FSP1.4" /LENGTH=160 /DNA_ID=CAMNT_0008356033 /DNA_START=68 /DNA_END=546 /DNA_ORIENTATION=+